jgi:Protein of unknown function (DUF3147)
MTGVLIVRALAGGVLVVAFSLLGEALRPKSFAGIFAAAPSVALASLIITAVADGPTAVALAASGMIVGALAMVAACVVGIDTVKRLHSVKGSLAAVAVWLGVAGGLYATVFR